jgi:two-component system, cell cycle sensor histidine kinase and response regulator CckA
MPAPVDSLPLPTVLIADDEPLVLKAISMTLLNNGYHVLQGRDGHEARAALEKHCGQPLHLIITDIDMPGYGGQELAHFAREQFSGVKVLYTSGKPRRRLPSSIAWDADNRFLEKPFATRDLMKSVRELLANDAAPDMAARA